MDMPRRCSMNMLWNAQIEDTCVVFRSWHITGWFTFVLSFLIIVLLAISYEWLRKLQRALDVQTAQRVTKANPPVSLSNGEEQDSTLTGAAPKL